MLKHYLTIGLIISLVVLLNSCKDDFYEQVGQYYFINETNYAIAYDTGLEKFNIDPKSTTLFQENSRGEGKSATALNFSSPFKHFGKELNIKFNNAKCLLNVQENDINSIRNIKNFKAEKLGDNHYKFTYSFTEADYNRAVTCP